MSRRIVILIMSVLTISYPISTLGQQADPFSIPASAAFAVDYDSGKVLYNQNGDEALGIASMTKILSAYLVYEAVEKGEITWDDTVPIDDDLIAMTLNLELSNIPLEKELTYHVEDLLKASLISSANAATIALARFISGDEFQFVDLMRDKLTTWGIDDAYIISSSGLGNEDMGDMIYPGSKKTDENMMSARSMAIVSRQTIRDYPDIINITSMPSFTLFPDTENEVTGWSSNDMLPGFDHELPGVDGFKTGTTNLAGATFTGTMIKDGHRIITVVMNVDPEVNRFEVTKDLLDHVFQTWHYLPILKKGTPSVQPTVKVRKGKKRTATSVLATDVYLWENDPSVPITRTFTPLTTSKLIAPIKKNETVGTEIVLDDHDSLGYLTEDEALHEVSVISESQVPKASFLSRIWYSLFNK